MEDGKREYKKDCTVEVYVGDRKNVTCTMLINTLRDYVSDIYACVPKGHDCFEITLPDVREARELVEQDDIDIGGQRLKCRLMYSETLVVSFMHLPAYIDDDVIINFLTSKGIEIKGDIKHRLIKGTDISDGTRYVRVKFPEHVKSLPYSVGFHTMDGYRYYRVIHSNQVKVCFKCGASDHELKSCPETKCFKCQGQGHMARDCDMKTCSICDMIEEKCTCHDDYEDCDYDDGDYSDSDTDTHEFTQDKDFPPPSRARETSETKAKPNTQTPSARENASKRDGTHGETNIAKDNSSVTGLVTKTETISSQWSTAARRQRKLRQPIKLNDNVIKENELKNKMRSNRKDEMKKKKDQQVNVKRDINDVKEKV